MEYGKIVMLRRLIEIVWQRGHGDANPYTARGAQPEKTTPKSRQKRQHRNKGHGSFITCSKTAPKGRPRPLLGLRRFTRKGRWGKPGRSSTYRKGSTGGLEVLNGATGQSSPSQAASKDGNGRGGGSRGLPVSRGRGKEWGICEESGLNQKKN